MLESQLLTLETPPVPLPDGAQPLPTVVPDGQRLTQLEMLELQEELAQQTRATPELLAFTERQHRIQSLQLAPDAQALLLAILAGETSLKIDQNDWLFVAATSQSLALLLSRPAGRELVESLARAPRDIAVRRATRADGYGNGASSCSDLQRLDDLRAMLQRGESFSDDDIGFLAERGLTPEPNRKFFEYSPELEATAPRGSIPAADDAVIFIDPALHFAPHRAYLTESNGARISAELEVVFAHEAAHALRIVAGRPLRGVHRAEAEAEAIAAGNRIRSEHFGPDAPLRSQYAVGAGFLESPSDVRDLPLF